jgi:hypothetical protein
LAAKRLPQPFGFTPNVDQAWSTEDMAEFVSIATSDGELADVNLDQITHMRPNPANKSQIIIHFAGGHTMLVPGDRRKQLVGSQLRPA